jgi:hypothetical protein
MSPRPIFVNRKTKGNGLPEIPALDGASAVDFGAQSGSLLRIV